MAKVYRAAVIGTSRMGAFIDNEIPLVEVSIAHEPLLSCCLSPASDCLAALLPSAVRACPLGLEQRLSLRYLPLVLHTLRVHLGLLPPRSGPGRGPRPASVPEGSVGPRS
jgi:hypothetical protein